MLNKLILYGLLVLSWCSLFKLNRFTFKRYLPVGTFTALIFTLLSGVNSNVKWWRVLEKVFPTLPGNFPFVFGPFILLPIWIFKFTFGRFWLYLIINILTGLALGYPITTLFEKLKIYRLNKMTRLHVCFLSISSSIVIYLYQLLIEEAMKKDPTGS